MTLIDKIRADQLAARKAKDQDKGSLLGTLIGEAVTLAKKTEDRPPTDEEVLGLVRKFVKNAGETRAVLVARPGTEAQVEAVDREVATLSTYLPRQMSEDELRAEIARFREANPQANKGAVMAHLKAGFAGLYDGKVAAGLAG